MTPRHGRTPTPDYGAMGFHMQGHRWFASLYIWRRGPWRLSWCRRGVCGHVETPTPTSFLVRTIVDTVWGLTQS